MNGYSIIIISSNNRIALSWDLFWFIKVIPCSLNVLAYLRISLINSSLRSIAESKLSLLPMAWFVKRSSYYRRILISKETIEKVKNNIGPHFDNLPFYANFRAITYLCYWSILIYLTFINSISTSSDVVWNGSLLISWSRSLLLYTYLVPAESTLLSRNIILMLSLWNWTGSVFCDMEWSIWSLILIISNSNINLNIFESKCNYFEYWGLIFEL